MYLHVEGYDGSSMASIHFHGAIPAIYYFHSCHQKYPAAARCTSIVRLSHMTDHEAAARCTSIVRLSHVTDHDHEAAHAYAWARAMVAAG